MRGLAEIGPVIQNEVEGASAYRLAAARLAGLEFAVLGNHAAGHQIGA